MKRLPILPTLLVLLMVPAMIALGIWQLHRAEWKAGVLSHLAANATAPVIDKPASLADRDTLSFRRVRTVCQAVRPWQPSAARSVTGAAGYRQVIWCGGGQGEPVLVSLGVATDPTIRATIAPGTSVTGPLVPHNGQPPFILIADRPVPPLAAEAPPTLDSIPDNHRAYAVQWFLFAASLIAIYLAYLRRWRRGAA